MGIIEKVVAVPVQQILVTTEQAAKLFAISPRKISDLTARGKLPVVKIDSSTRYRVRDLYQFANDNVRGGI
ncbi:MAG: helix-turn-helix domain-containing protein [Planctomycetaceae bacterium]